MKPSQENLSILFWGREVYKDSLVLEVPDESWKHRAYQNIQKLSPFEKEGLHMAAEQNNEDIQKYLMGQIILVRTGLQTVYEGLREDLGQVPQELCTAIMSQVWTHQEDIQEDLRESKIDFSEQKVITQAITALENFANQLLNPEPESSEKQKSTPTSASPETSSIFKDLVFYDNYIENPDSFSHLDQKDRILLKWLKQKLELSSDTLVQLKKDGLRDAHQLQALTLKIGLESRTSYLFKPFANQLTAFVDEINPLLEKQPLLAKSLSSYIRNLSGRQTIIKQELNQLIKVSDQEVDAVQNFIRSAPENTQGRIQAYQKPIFSFPSELLPQTRPVKKPFSLFKGGSKKTSPTSPRAKINARRSGPIKMSYVIGLSVALLASGMYHQNKIWGWFHYFSGKGIGTPLNINSYRVRQKTWVGTLPFNTWKKLDFQHRYEKGKEVFKLAQEKGFEHIEVRDTQNRLLGKSVERGREKEWLLITH